MCEANKRFFLYLPLALLFAFASGALQAEEQGPWYLISETELQSIELYKANKEQETQNLLSQVRELNMKAEKSEARSERLEADSMNSNRQLSLAREQNRKLATLFNEYAQDWLIQASLKNGEIADLKQTVAEQTLETEKYRGIAWNRLFVIIALGAAWIIFIAFKILRFFKIIKIQ
jgi:hypothetical protein